MSLYNKHRPKTLKGLLGQDGAVVSLQRMMDNGEVPHALLLSGPSGCGKTTIARILREHLGCGRADYDEIDCALVESPLQTVRDVRRASALSPMDGKCRIFFLEEVQSLSRAGFSQQALLKMLEDVPDHVYYLMATTDPNKLHRAIRTRCTEINLVTVSDVDMAKLVRRLADRERMSVSDRVIDEIVEASDGSPRKAIVILEQVGKLEDEKEQLRGVISVSVDKDKSILLARALLNPRCAWPEVASLLKDNKDDPEQIRYLVLGYCRSVMLGGGKLAPRAFAIIDVFSDNFWDSKQAGLAAACWEVVHYQRK